MSERIVNVRQADYGGKHFRSTLEAQTAKVLDALGIPYQYEERKIILQEGFRCPYQKDKVRDLTYTADFIIGPIMLECKGFETPEWKIKKKLVYKWLMDNEPDTAFYQIHDAKKSLLEMLDAQFVNLGYAVQVTKKPTRKEVFPPKMYDSVREAVADLGIKAPLGSILTVLTGKKEYTCGYNFKLIKLTI